MLGVLSNSMDMEEAGRGDGGDGELMLWVGLGGSGWAEMEVAAGNLFISSHFSSTFFSPEKITMCRSHDRNLNDIKE